MSFPFDPSIRANASPIDGDARATARTPEQLQVAALVQQFEGMLLTEMLRDLRMEEPDDSSFGLGGDTMADTMRAELGLSLSKAGGLGLGDMLARAFARQQGVDTVEGTAPIVAVPAGIAIGSAPAASAATTPPVVAALDPSAVSSPYGWRGDPFTGQARFHAGTDLRLAYGTPVAAPAAGTVNFAGERGGYGTTIVIDHGNGRETLFAHLSSLDARVGDRVEAGQTIARSGNSGRSTGPHLHVEVREDGRPVDPRSAHLDLHETDVNGSW